MHRRAATAGADFLGFDRGSVRSTDSDGRMRVKVANLSRCAVNPYLAEEIPGWEELGLVPGRTYEVYRPADELARAAPTFRNVPLLTSHVPVSADDPKPELVVGSVGSDVVFAAPYLKASLIVWDADAIARIESDEARELSCAYRYVATLENGTFEGQPFQLRMSQIEGNHVALVGQGRVSGAVVGDAAPRRPTEKFATAQDSADAAAKLALDALGVNTAGIHPTAYRHILAAGPRPSEAARAMGAASFSEMFPNANRIKAI